MKFVPCDIETTGLDHNRDKIIGVALKEKYHDRTDGEVFDLPGPCAFHNGKFDVKFLNRDSGDNRWTPLYSFDTMLASSVLVNRPESLALDSVAAHYLKVETWKDETNKIFKQKEWWLNPENVEKVRQRGIKDLEVTGQLTEELQTQLRKEGVEKFFFDRIMPAARMLTEVESRGMRIDVEATRKKLAQLNSEIETLTTRLNKQAGQEINWRSPKQIIPILKAQGFTPECYDHKKCTVVESSRDEALQPHKEHPIVADLLKHRELTKLGGYLEGWLEEQFNGRIYTTYNMANTRTGRLSSSGPNLQQVPRDKSIRSLFIPSDGKVFVIADYPQIEPRFAAHYSQDEALLNVFKNREDFYGSIAVKVLGVKCTPNEVKTHFPQIRQIAKVIGLSILYGIGPKKLADFIRLQTGQIFTRAQCEAIIRDYFRAYPGLLELRKYVEKKISERGVLTNHYGRKIKINIEDVFAQGVNSLIQSSASDACLFSQLKFDNHPHAQLVAIVHDEVVYEVEPEHAEAFGKELCAHMSNIGITCPIEMEYAVASSWGGKK